MTGTGSGARPVLMPLAVTLFAVGLLAVLVVLLLFALGYSDLPVWLSASAGVLTSLGFALGLIALVREARSPA